MYVLPLAKMLMKLKIRVTIIFYLLVVMVMLAVIVPAQTVFAAPAISLSPSAGVSGTRVTISGASFGSYAGDQLTIYFDNIDVTPSVSTISSGGIFQATFLVPDYTIPGSHIISVKGRSGVILAENQFYVLEPEIILNVWSGIIGTTIKASCIGFHAGKDVSIQYYYTNSSVILGSQTASDIGECTEEFIIPASATGRHEVIAQNEFRDSAKTDFEVIPSLSINPSVVGVGDQVSILGTGFTANSEVGVTLHGKKVALAQVSERGSFVAIFYVPVIKIGTYAVEIGDSSLNNMWIYFTVESEATISKPTGAVGLKLLVNGTGFEAEGIIQIKYDDEEMTAVMVDSNGSFSTYFNVPVSAAGAHTVTITDGFNTQQIVFTVESDPPPVPQPTAPKLNSVVEAQVSFDWESVYDPSEPVSYTLQIARTADFSQPILEKEGLSLSHYELTKDEALHPSRRSTYYFWRVRATDSASNEGTWSNPIAFQVEPSNILPEWAEYVLIFIGILLVIIAFILIKKGAKSQKDEKKT